MIVTTIEDTILINARIEDIEAISLDGWRLPEWYAGIDSVQVDEFYPEPGSRVRMAYKAAGITFDLTMTVIEMDYDDHFSTYQMEGMITGTNQWQYSQEGDMTRIWASFDYQMPGGGAGKVVDKLIIERMNAENLHKSLQNLKRLAEI